MNFALRLGSIALLLAAWIAASHLLGPRLLPAPQAVVLSIIHEARTGALGFNLGITLLRVLAVIHHRHDARHIHRDWNGPQARPSTGLLTHG